MPTEHPLCAGLPFNWRDHSHRHTGTGDRHAVVQGVHQEHRHQQAQRHEDDDRWP